MNFGKILEEEDVHAPAQTKAMHESILLRSKKNLFFGVPKTSKNVIVNKGTIVCEILPRNYLLLHI